MPMYNRPHPGEALREDVLPALGLSVIEVCITASASISSKV